MKRLIFSILTMLASISMYADDPNEKILKAFNKTFDDAKEVTWQGLSENMYEAAFSHNEITCRVVYDEEGNVRRTLRYYKGSKLPIMLQARISSKYEGKTIFGVTEVSTTEGIRYHIVLENETDFQHIESDEFGNSVTTKKFKKA